MFGIQAVPGSILVAALLASSPAWGGEKPFWMVPDVSIDERLRLEDDTWVLPFSGLEIRVQFLNPPSRKTFLEERVPDLIDPFLPNTMFPRGYFLFRLDLNNHTAEPVIFHPGNVIVVTKRNLHELAMEYSDFYRRLVWKGQSPEKFLRRWMKVYYDGSHTLKPGESTSKLIAFNLPRGKWKKIHLFISSIQVAGDTHNFRFPFIRIKPDPSKSSGTSKGTHLGDSP